VPLAACSAPDVSQELGLAAKAVENANTAIQNELSAQAPADAARKQSEAAAQGYYWTISPECGALAALDLGVLPGACRIDRDITNQPLSISQSDAATRKMAALTAYFAGLDALASARSDGEINAGVAAVNKALQGLDAASNGGEVSFVGATLAQVQPQIDRAVSAAVRQRRARARFEVVTQADPLVSDLVKDIIAHLQALGVDPRYDVLAERMMRANADATTAWAGEDPDLIAAAYARLERARDAFVAHAETSIYTKLAAIAGTHGGLSARLATDPPPEDLQDYIQSLRALAPDIGRGD